MLWEFVYWRMLPLVSKKLSESAELCCVCGCISGLAVWVRFSLL